MLRSDHSAFSTRLPVLPAVLFVLLGLAALGCTPHIGDECTVSTNCSASGDRLCDITEPGGYCTIFNCEPNTCPDNAVCINFGTTLSPVDQCYSSQGNSPYQRSFCMAPCSVNSDCRGGYSCQNLKGDADNPNEVGAVLADDSGNGMVCAAKRIGQPASKAGTSNEVCLGSDAGPPADNSDAGPPADNGGSAGSDATGGSGAGGAPSEAGAGG